MADMRSEPLNYAERWMHDGIAVLRPAVGVCQCTVNMTKAMRRLDQFRKEGILATPTHLLIQATARALAANPDLHKMITGNRRYQLGRVDIGLSVTGDSFIDPVMIIENAHQKTVKEIVAEIDRRMPEVREDQRKMLEPLSRWGWIIPFGFLRRAILRLLFRNVMFRRKGVGTFQVTTTTVDWAAGTSFSMAGLLIGAPVRMQVAAVNGQPAVRPEMKLTLCADHGVWDGRAATRMLVAVQTELEKGAAE